MDGTITSSPGPTPNPDRAMCNAEVPVLTAIACLQPMYFLISSSSAKVVAPNPSHPDWNTSAMALSSSWPTDGREIGIIVLYGGWLMDGADRPPGIQRNERSVNAAGPLFLNGGASRHVPREAPTA